MTFYSHISTHVFFVFALQLEGRVIWTGRSSLDILLELIQEGATVIRALFTFVARQALGNGPQAVNPLVPQTPEDKERFDSRQRVADERKAARAAHQLNPHMTRTFVCRVFRVLAFFLSQ